MFRFEANVLATMTALGVAGAAVGDLDCCEFEVSGDGIQASSPKVEGFGHSLGVDGDYAVVGCPEHFIQGSASIGRALVFHRDAQGAWSEQDVLALPSPHANHRFGLDVAISGDLIVVGSENAELVRVHRRDGTDWPPVEQITASDGQSGDHFGRAVAISGTTIVVVGDDSLYTFEEVTTDVWEEQTQIITSSLDGFGSDLAVHRGTSNDWLVIGADEDDTVLVYTDVNGEWDDEQTLTGSGISFGASVAVGEDTLVIGAPGYSGGGTALIYRYGGSSWAVEAQVFSCDGASGDLFGRSVGLSDTGTAELVIVGGAG